MPRCRCVIPANAVMRSGEDRILTLDSLHENPGKSKLRVPLLRLSFTNVTNMVLVLFYSAAVLNSPITEGQ